MRTQSIHQDLPDLYRNFLPELFEQLIPVETLATCNNCAMCLKPGDAPLPNVDYFRPDVKCCSYFPKLPNYLVGGLLTDNNPAMDEGTYRDLWREWFGREEEFYRECYRAVEALSKEEFERHAGIIHKIFLKTAGGRSK